jgi:DNA-binding response OmpR family regulator
MTIVVVEDDLLLAETLATRLGQGGFTTETVGDGAAALPAVPAQRSRTRP